MHVHTEYSALDGLATIDELTKKASELGHKYIAITDHGSTSGLYECKKIGQKYGIKILLGSEFYFENPAELKNGHLILIAKNKAGLRNLFELQAAAIENFYYKPRINLEMLKKHSEGLICTTACIANQIGQYILKNKPNEAWVHIKELQNIFGDDLYVEMQSTVEEDVKKVNLKLEEFCEYYGYKPIVTNDVHYVNKEDAKIHEALLCIQQKSKMNSQKRWKFNSNDYWLKDQKEMEDGLTHLKNSTIKKCYKNLDEIADKCEIVDLEYGDYLPKFCKTKFEEDEELEEMVIESCYHGKIKKRNEKNKEFMDDIQKELKVISETGYSGYFLIVQEYINWARKNNVLVGDGRGSGAGSKVAYAIGITEVNPQKYDLLFERFLSVGREPDFDVDFSDIGKVFEHLQERYGSRNVARVGAYSRFTAKSALRKVMGIYGFTQSEIAKIVALMPKRLSFTLQEAIDENKELFHWFEQNEIIYETVKKLENKLDHYSTHAGGVIICENLTSILPVMQDKEIEGKLIVALDKKQLESLGHYKFDVLGLESLTLMENIQKYTGKIEWHKIDLEDENIYKMLRKGDTLGVFQLSNQKEKVMEQGPKCFEDLISINALIRPGVCDWNEYLNARKNKVTSDLDYMNCTHGLIVYQDQYLQLARTYAGWDIAYSDKHIRKNKDILHDDELREKWMKDSNGKEELWNTICEIVTGGYGFNRAHSTSYAMLSYQTAYMKYFHPVEFYAAYMTQNIDDSTKINEAIAECKSKGIKLTKPDINQSKEEFIPMGEEIQMPLSCIKGISNSVISEIQRLRPIKDIDDLLERRIRSKIRKNNIESLIKAGCFEGNRNELLQKYLGLESNKKDYEHEKDVFGFYIEKTPFDDLNIKSILNKRNGDSVMTVAAIDKINVRYDKNGKQMAFINAYNNVETIKMIVFSNKWKEGTCEEGQIVLVKGKKDNDSILVNSIERLEVE